MSASKQQAYTGQLRADWTKQSVGLRQAYEAANRSADDLARRAIRSNTLKSAATQASLSELTAAKAFNDFLETGANAYKLSQEIGTRLKRPDLSLLERHQLEVEQSRLLAASEAFSDFKNDGGLKPYTPPPVYANDHVYYADGTVKWDSTTATGQLGSLWDTAKAKFPQLLHAATLPQEDQFKACVGVFDAFTGALAGKALPGKSFGGQHTSDVWEQMTGKAFPSSPAEQTCRLIYPADNVPAHLRKYGALTEGHDDALGDLVAIDIHASLLARFGLADALAAHVAAGTLEASEAQAWLIDITGSDPLMLPPLPALPEYSYQVAGLVLPDANPAIWSDAGLMGGVPWVAPIAGKVQEVDRSDGVLIGQRPYDTPTPSSADGTPLQQQVHSPVAPAMPIAHKESTFALPTQPEPIPHITTHEERITPTPGGMSFAEAHQRRDEPEQISPGSLQPVGKRAQPDRQHELTLLREIGIVNARVKEELGRAPKLHEAPQPSLERTQQRGQDATQDLAPRRTLTEAVVQPVPSPEMKAVAPQTLAPAQPTHAPDQRVAAPAPSQTTTPSAPDGLEMQARLAAKEAELAAARAQIARLSVQGFAVPQASEPRAARAEPAAPVRPTDPRDPAHPDHKDFQKIFDVLTQDGRWNAQQSTSIASQALADFKGDRLAKRLDVVLLEPDTRGQLKLFVGHAPWGGLRCLSVAAVDPVQAARVPPEQSFERLEQATQMAQQREIQDAQRWAQQHQQQQGNTQGPRP